MKRVFTGGVSPRGVVLIAATLFCVAVHAVIWGALL